MDKLVEELDFDELEEILRDCISYDGYFDDLDYHEFDEEFFDIYFQGKDRGPMEACRATVFGSVNWMDEYIHFDGYGNLESCSQWEYEQEVKDRAEEIVEHYLELYEDNNVEPSTSLKIKIDDYLEKEENEV